LLTLLQQVEILRCLDHCLLNVLDIILHLLHFFDNFAKLCFRLLIEVKYSLVDLHLYGVNPSKQWVHIVGHEHGEFVILLYLVDLIIDFLKTLFECFIIYHAFGVGKTIHPFIDALFYLFEFYIQKLLLLRCLLIKLSLKL
jgi:hypothetical protein